MINSFAPVDPSLIDYRLPVESGYPLELAKGDSFDALWDAAGDASTEFPSSLWIEKSDWPEWAARNDRLNTWPMSYAGRYTHQGNSHECTCHSLAGACEIARNRTLGVSIGPPKAKEVQDGSRKFGDVWLSPMSVYAEANPGQWGGASIRQVLSIATKRGFLPDRVQPRDYGFRHTLQGTIGQTSPTQGGGAWTPVSRFPSGWTETAKWFRPLEVIFPRSAEQIICLLLHRYSVCVGRNGHAIRYWRYLPSQNVVGYGDSYDVERYDSWRTVQSAVSGAYAVVSMTMPDDRSRPVAY